jgi:uracil-DNA glycosylase family 4
MKQDPPEVNPPDTSFVPQLDARQRAMLAEMGVRVWAPKPMRMAIPQAVKALAVAVPSAPPRVVAAPIAAPVRSAAPAPSAATLAPEQSRAPQAPSLKPLPDGVASMDWPALQAAVSECTACGLCQRRKNAVFGQGDVQADWMVVGDAPNEAEDAQGLPFIGPEGELLDNMLRAVGQSREKGAYITSVVKCRPPASRNPGGEELVQCSAYLARQVALVQPKVIIAMGRFALEVLTQSRDHLGRLRGREHVFEGVPVIATYHPDALLRTAADKAKAWADLCRAMDVVERSTTRPD